MAENPPQAGNNNVQVVEKPVPEGNKKKKLLLVIIVLLLMGLLGVGAWYILSEPEFDTTDDVIVTDTTPEPTQEPSPTMTPEPIDRAEISIQVLNGTGVAGEAGLLQDELEGIEYEDIEVDNADDQDYESAEVTFDENLSQTAVTEITDLLEEFYSGVTVRTESLEDYDVVIITGPREGMAVATATPEPTVTPDEGEDDEAATPTPSPTPER